ncbi:hypothetical protein HPB51_002991 [Rhipicephalus microplus]|uniref:Uncharacterized protein n=1 Tax=Rhipicephalus microplus TaxID=6941 RepID=A0A9J6DSH9_RHIMP|nr:hypothetical protein HPB51_002991 [Rhipicephalus microplus]
MILAKSGYDHDTHHSREVLDLILLRYIYRRPGKRRKKTKSRAGDRWRQVAQADNEEKKERCVGNAQKSDQDLAEGHTRPERCPWRLSCRANKEPGAHLVVLTVVPAETRRNRALSVELFLSFPGGSRSGSRGTFSGLPIPGATFATSACTTGTTSSGLPPPPETAESRL